MTAIRIVGLVIASLGLMSVAEAQKGGGKPGGGGKPAACAQGIAGVYIGSLTEVVYVGPFAGSLPDNMVAARRDGLVSFSFDPDVNTVTAQYEYAEAKNDGLPTKIELSQTWAGTYQVDQQTCRGSATLALENGNGGGQETFAVDFIVADGATRIDGYRLDNDVEDDSFILSNFVLHSVGACPTAIKGTYVGVAKYQTFLGYDLDQPYLQSIESSLASVDTAAQSMTTNFSRQLFPDCLDEGCFLGTWGVVQEEGVNNLELLFDEQKCTAIVSRQLPCVECAIQLFAKYRIGFVESGQKMIVGDAFIYPSIDFGVPILFGLKSEAFRVGR